MCNGADVSARRIVQIMRNANTGPDEIMMRGALEAAFFQPDNATPEAFEDGMRLAVERGWITIQDATVTLTRVGNDQDG